MTATLTHAEAPGAVAAAAEGQTKNSDSMRASSSTIVADFDPSAPVDYSLMSPAEFRAYLAGSVHGYRDGYNACATEEWENAWPAAREVVANIAKAPERDHEADRRQAERRAAWWAHRRGENA